MSQDYISVAIEGDYIDSFIYSGTLFLVHGDSRITTYDWASLLQSTLHKSSEGSVTTQIYEFLKDCRCGMVADAGVSTINIEQQQLEDQLIFDLQLNGWPTDINIYSNCFYIASEDGVDELAFDYQSKSLKPDERFRVWHEYAYRVSANDGHRLAIAAGANGVITATPRKGYIKENEDVIKLLEIDSHDCEWIGQNLIANSSSGAYVSTFPALPERPNGPLPPGYWREFEAARRSRPDTRKVELDGDISVAYAWIAGSKLFSFLSNGELSVERMPISDEDANSQEISDVEGKFLNLKTGFKMESSILAARSGSFGAVIETSSNLITVTERGCQILANRPVSWRVFPRARNYLNHLHVVEDDQLIIHAFLAFEGANGDQSDRFGISTDDVR
ncbi:hypothetical protein [Paraburkholderia nemoris]|uniref:hypothetical protein n=1 Tax=Paraburkholderia nemoris TaxID=2793076 RepID=UPI001B2E99E1|nr:hypothetical protein [Paraburkholderia nemoris]CAE6804095.1 hypothetical protein LMG22931_05550 [Paraburkholderia nemoris]